MTVYKLKEDSLHDKFMCSRAKIQIIGGGFGNGKTAAACIKAIHLAKDYPSGNGLIARETYPKLNDTIRKEFLKWCPASWIKSFPKSQNSSNTCALSNNTSINFRYIAQQGKNAAEATTSNLLSATYDWIVIDQVEDPEISEKDFFDLLGRLRGNAPYIGRDPTMPRSGPRWIILTTNPNRGWVYRKLVKPLHDLARGIYNEDLLCETDHNGVPILTNGKPTPIIELFEGSTYENADNLEPDFIATLEATYRGQMRDRYLLGKWAAYEGLVYKEFSEETHVISHALVEQHYFDTKKIATVTVLEGFDYGLAVPSCYLLGFADLNGNVFIMDGFYGNEPTIESYAKRIKDLRKEYVVSEDNWMHTDPDLFRRGKASTLKGVATPISDLLFAEKVKCVRGDNDIINGITKITQYLAVIKGHAHPLTREYGAPHLFVSSKLDFFVDEISEYYWKRDTDGETVDKPVDKKDHAMDTLKYMMTTRPPIARIIPFAARKRFVVPKTWTEVETTTRNKAHRYG